MAVQMIDVKALARLMEHSKDLCLIDVRTPAEYEGVHASGARLLPLSDLDPKRFMEGRSGKTDSIYLICKGGTRSRKAAEMFIASGFDNVVSVDGGTEAWVSAGLPVDKSERRVLPLDRQMQLAAGSICLVGLILGTWVNPWFYLLSAMVGCGLTMAGLTGFCPMMIMLSKMPWNQAKSATSCSAN